MEAERTHMIENSPNPSLKQSVDCLCSSRFPIIFFSLFYLQTLIFLAENRKFYQIGITVLLAVVFFFPKDGMNLSLVRKPSAVYAQTDSEPEKENEGGGKPWVIHFKTKSCGLQTPCLRRRLTTGQRAPTGNRGVRRSALCLVTLLPVKKREEDAKSGSVSPGQFSMEMAAGFVARCPPHHCRPLCWLH